MKKNENTLRIINKDGKCASTATFDLPFVNVWPASLSWFDESVVGCGSACYILEDTSCDDCYSYNTNTNEWKRIRTPTDQNLNLLNYSSSFKFPDQLKNINNELFIFFDKEVQVYSPENDTWTRVTEVPQQGVNSRIDFKCIVDLGNKDFFIRLSNFDDGMSWNYKFNIDSREWKLLPKNRNSQFLLSHCLKVDSPNNGGTAVMLIGGVLSSSTTTTTIAPTTTTTTTTTTATTATTITTTTTTTISLESRKVEILDMDKLVWEDKASIDDRWIFSEFGIEYSFYSLLYLDDKPTIIGQFDDTNMNVMEQYSIEEDTWSLEYFDLTDPPCDSNYPCLENFVNIPAELFPSC